MDKMLFACSGNAGGEVSYPARYDSVVAVGATYPNDSRCEWSNYGLGLDLVAPGYNINTTTSGGGYAPDDGTSFAAPHAAAAAALIWSAYPDSENWEVEDRLLTRIHDLGAPDWDEETGYGLVNAYRPSQKPEGNLNSDDKVDIFDAAMVAISFGSKPGDTNWNVIADSKIDRLIDIFDLVIVAGHSGWEA